MKNHQPGRPGAATLCASLLLFAGCATTSEPIAAIASAQTAINAASTDGAAEVSSAELTEARGKLERAKRLAADDRLAAHRLAEEAQADAELARARAMQQRSQRALNEVNTGLQQLRDELRRSSMQPPRSQPSGSPGTPGSTGSTPTPR